MIGIIVPVYKVEKYIRRCVDSIVQQSYSDFKLILVDDGSPDQSGEICDEYAEQDTRIIVLHKENGGLSSARNVGIEYALQDSKIEWITFIDSDDWIADDYLKLLFEITDQNDVKIAACKYIRVESEDTVNEIHGNYEILTPEEYWLLKDANPRIACAKLYRKELWNSIRFPEGRIFEDEATTYKILFSIAKIAYSEDQLYFYYINPEGITGTKWTAKNLDKVRALREQTQYFAKNHLAGAYEASLKLYLYFLYDSLIHIEEDKNQSCYQKWKVRILLQYALLRCGIVDRSISMKKDDYYVCAFPVLSWIYLHIKAGIKRIIL